VLFEDQLVTETKIADAVVRRRREDDLIFEHAVEPVGDNILQVGGEIVATGGFMLHYTCHLPICTWKSGRIGGDIALEVSSCRR